MVSFSMIPAQMIKMPMQGLRTERHAKLTFPVIFSFSAANTFKR